MQAHPKMDSACRTKVPQRDDRRPGEVVFKTENVERCGIEQEMLRLAHRQPNPARGQNSSEMTMRKKRDISLQRAEARNQAVGAVGNLAGHFTVRTVVAEEIPVRARLENVGRVFSLVVAIVPLRQVRLDFDSWNQPGQFTRSLRPQSRAGEHPAEIETAQPLSQFARVRLALF